jgi:negative regulator of flagellin synthesis FlgM
VSGKISGATNNQPPSAAAGSVGQRAAATASPAPNAPNTTASATAAESVQITNTASHLVTAEQGLSGVPVVNQGRVSEIRNALASGTYRISPERISNQLLQFERLLPPDSAE